MKVPALVLLDVMNTAGLAVGASGAGWGMIAWSTEVDLRSQTVNGPT